VWPTLCLAAALATLSIIDVCVRRLPDYLTLPLIAGGLVMSLLNFQIELQSSLLGAGFGFAAFWLLAFWYRNTRGLDGLGLGDAKLLAAAGAWLGPLYLAPIVFVSALLAIVCALLLRAFGSQLSWRSTLPFGPFLSVGFFAFWCLKVSGFSPF